MAKIKSNRATHCACGQPRAGILTSCWDCTSESSEAMKRNSVHYMMRASSWSTGEAGERMARQARLDFSSHNMKEPIITLFGDDDIPQIMRIIGANYVKGNIPYGNVISLNREFRLVACKCMKNGELSSIDHLVMCLGKAVAIAGRMGYMSCIMDYSLAKSFYRDLRRVIDDQLMGRGFKVRTAIGSKMLSFSGGTSIRQQLSDESLAAIAWVSGNS